MSDLIDIRTGESPRKYKPTAAQQKQDAAIEGFKFSKGMAKKLKQQVNMLTLQKQAAELTLGKEAARQQVHHFRYLSALSTTSRINANPLTSGEILRGSRDKMQVMWNAIDLIDNSGLCSSILDKLPTYICGTVKYQSRTGNKKVNKIIEDYIADRSGKSLDLANRRTLRQQAKFTMRAKLLKGDTGINLPRVNDTLFTQGIEGDRIGDPYNYAISNEFVRGVHLDEKGKLSAFDIYIRDRMSGRYVYDTTIPGFDSMGLPSFLFTARPISFDDVRGISIFNTAINNAEYIRQMREYELLAMLWASSRSGVFYTKSGMLPPGDPFAESINIPGYAGQNWDAMKIHPNQITALGVGEKAELYRNDRPSPNVLAMYDNTIKDIAISTGCSYGFVWDMSGMTNPAVRYYSGQDKRAIESHQLDLTEDMLQPLIILLIMEGIADGEIPYVEGWNKGAFIFPPHPTIDAGDESTAHVAEINAGVNSATRVALDNGDEIQEITSELNDEACDRIEKAVKAAEELNKKFGTDLTFREILGMVKQVQGETRMSPDLEAAHADQATSTADKSRADAKAALEDPEKVGASSTGKDLQ